MVTNGKNTLGAENRISIALPADLESIVDAHNPNLARLPHCESLRVALVLSFSGTPCGWVL